MTKAHTAWPIPKCITAEPVATTTPATSKPGISEAPSGGGYKPLHCSRSGRLTPAAKTLMRTWSAEGLGMSRSVSLRVWSSISRPRNICLGFRRGGVLKIVGCGYYIG